MEQNTMVPNFYWKPDDLSVSYFLKISCNFFHETIDVYLKEYM